MTPALCDTDCATHNNLAYSKYTQTGLVICLSTTPLRSTYDSGPRLLLSLHMKAQKLAHGQVDSVFQLSILRHT